MPRVMFTDGMKFNTSGPLRIESRSDGFYVVGNGMLYPADTIEEAERVITTLRSLLKPES